jgi:hypothetical protein
MRPAESLLAASLIEGKLLSSPSSEVANSKTVPLPWDDFRGNSSGFKNEANSSNMELNVACEALESMRKFNLEVECQERGIRFTEEDLATCSCCLLLNGSRPDSSKNNPFDAAIALFLDSWKRPKPAPPCLICAAPVCKSHSSRTFRREGITLCCDCEGLFGMDYVVDILTDHPTKRQEKLDKLLERYDRARLLLQCSTQYIAGIVTSLEESTVVQNRVNMGSSGAGIVSGVLGVACAATLFTPVGPPLLITSLLFGGSATAVSATSEVRNYLSESRQMADRILALHSVCDNILRVLATLRDALLLDGSVRTDFYASKSGVNSKLIMTTGKDNTMQEYLKRHGIDLVASATSIGSVSTVGITKLATSFTKMEEAAAAARQMRFFGKSSTAALSTMRFAQIAGGILAAATVVLEAKSMSCTVLAMQAGNPCEKAQRLLQISEQMDTLPCTDVISAECTQFLAMLTARQRILTQDEVARLLSKNGDILQRAQEIAMMEDESEVTMDGSMSSSASLFGRIESRKGCLGAMDTSISENDDAESVTSSSTLSLLERIELHKQRERQQKEQGNSDIPQLVALKGRQKNLPA